MAEEPQQIKQLFLKDLNLEGSLLLRNKARDIEDKCDQIFRLQNSIKQLLSMIKEVQLIINSQGETIQTVAQKVAQSKDYVEMARGNLKQGKIYHQ